MSVFNQEGVIEFLFSNTDEQLDDLDFGVVGFDINGIVKHYNATESKIAGLRRERVIGQDFFFAVAPCMNNFMVAQVFEDARAEDKHLDLVIDYVLTLRMKPTKVKLRLLSSPAVPTSYVLIQRHF
ncbi:PAS domain-containing protein [Herbaspirillum rhizosphaerae]|uniref:Photoactive yellow protein n=1 Tax=Herbaspirillum rhizosphaerae TaxID=346179 RepID=A0ABW8ZDV3_9BURK